MGLHSGVGLYSGLGLFSGMGLYLEVGSYSGMGLYLEVGSYSGVGLRVNLCVGEDRCSSQTTKEGSEFILLVATLWSPFVPQTEH